MRKPTSHSIITKQRQPRLDVALLMILGVGIFLRFFRIFSLVEFLGDQGRTSIIIYNWLHGGALPLAGPTTLTGQHLGPIFYYLLAPFYILGGFHPLAGSIGMVVYGVCAIYMVYLVVRLIYGRYPALCMALLYAVSPIIVMQDRIIWEPNLVVLFALIYVYFAIRQHDRVSFRNNIGLGASCGVLVQLHYPNLIFVAGSILLFIGHAIRVREWRSFWRAVIGWWIGFFVVTFPFLMYEWNNKFRDVIEVLSIMYKGAAGLGERAIIFNVFDYTGHVFGFILPGINIFSVFVLCSLWFFVLVKHFNSWNIFWTGWLGFGIIIFSKYNGVVFDHYLLFLLPPVLLMFASILSHTTKNIILQMITLFVIGGIATFQLINSDVWREGTFDLTRTDALVRAIISDTRDTPYTFTVISSRSFSDLQFRYYFLRYGMVPRPLTPNNYDTLYIICDDARCPKLSELLHLRPYVMCYESPCIGESPRINLLQDYIFKKELVVPFAPNLESRIYIFFHR